MEAAFGRLHNSGAGAFGARPTAVEVIMVDGQICGSTHNRTIYPTIFGSTNGAEIDIPSERLLKNFSNMCTVSSCTRFVHGWDRIHNGQQVCSLTADVT